MFDGMAAQSGDQFIVGYGKGQGLLQLYYFGIVAWHSLRAEVCTNVSDAHFIAEVAHVYHCIIDVEDE